MNLLFCCCEKKDGQRLHWKVKNEFVLMFCFLLFGQGLCKTDVQGRCEKDRTWCVVGCCVAWGCDVGMEVMHTDESLRFLVYLKVQYIQVPWAEGHGVDVLRSKI